MWSDLADSDSDFYFFALLQEASTKITIHYKSKKKYRTTNYINPEK